MVYFLHVSCSKQSFWVLFEKAYIDSIYARYQRFFLVTLVLRHNCSCAWRSAASLPESPASEL